jgi:hypothetical protein
MYKPDNPINNSEIRRIQPIHGSTSWVLVIPKSFINKLNIQKGDYVKCTIVGQELHLKKAEV